MVSHIIGLHSCKRVIPDRITFFEPNITHRGSFWHRYLQLFRQRSEVFQTKWIEFADALSSQSELPWFPSLLNSITREHIIDIGYFGHGSSALLPPASDPPTNPPNPFPPNLRWRIMGPALVTCLLTQNIVSQQFNDSWFTGPVL